MTLSTETGFLGRKRSQQTPLIAIVAKLVMSIQGDPIAAADLLWLNVFRTAVTNFVSGVGSRDEVVKAYQRLPSDLRQRAVEIAQDQGKAEYFASLVSDDEPTPPLVPDEIAPAGETRSKDDHSNGSASNDPGTPEAPEIAEPLEHHDPQVDRAFAEFAARMRTVEPNALARLQVIRDCALALYVIGDHDAVDRLSNLAIDIHNVPVKDVQVALANARKMAADRAFGGTQERVESTSSFHGWPELDRSLVDEDRSPPPEFDWDALPPAWIDWIKETAEDCGAPPDYVAGTLIATTSAVIGNSRRVSPRELWVEQPHLWLALVGAPSTNKTVALAPFKSACSAIEKDSAGAHDKAVKNYTERKEVADAAQREWQSAVKEAVKNGHTPPPLPDNARQPDKPIPPRVMISDASTEEVGALLAGNLHGLVLVRSELSGWLGQFDRYSGAGADRAFYLEAWDGGSHVIDRVKFNGAPLRVPYASLAIVGSLQPDHLSKVFRGIDDGLAARFLYVWPSPVAPKRPDRPNPKNHIKTLQDAFKQLRKLGWGRDDYGDQIPLIMRLDEAALEILHKVQMEVFTANQIRGAGIMAGWRGKNPGRLLRIALGFEFLEWVVRGGAEPTTISGDMTARAADFLQYCTAMMRHALRDLLITDVQRDAAKLARFIESEAPQTINEREVYKREGFHSLRNDKAHRDKVFAALEEAGWIRRVSNGATGGRPRGDWTVSPKVRRAGA
jgi:hypothetical protein